MRQTNTVIRSHARKMVYQVYCYMGKEAKTEKETVKRTADATKTSERTVRRIVKESRNFDLNPVFRTPGKKRNKNKPITDIEPFDLSMIRSCVHNYHITNTELPTAEKLRKKLKEEINFCGSERSLRRILNNLEFRWKKAENNKLLIEKTKIRLLRIEFLKKLMKYRQEERPIVYTDESYVNSYYSGSISDGSSKGLKKPLPKGQRIVIVHAASEAGFVPNALLLFQESGDSPGIINYENYTKWLRSQLIPNLPPNAVLVMDNASYHNKQHDPAPTANAKKADMHRWLAGKGIEYEDSMLKPQLYKLIKSYKRQHKPYNIDVILAEHNHRVLRLPPHHPDLNPIEMAWTAINRYVASKNVTWNVSNVIELVKEKVALMDADEWSTLCDKVKKIESDYIKSDVVVDSVTEQFIINASDDSDSSDSGSEESDVEEPTPSTSSSSAAHAVYLPEASLLDSDSDDSVYLVVNED